MCVCVCVCVCVRDCTERCVCVCVQPVLEVVYHLHTHSILTLDFILERYDTHDRRYMIIRACTDRVMFVMIRDAAVSAWISDQLKALCVSVKTSADDQQIRQILSSKTHLPPSHICPVSGRHINVFFFSVFIIFY